MSYGISDLAFHVPGPSVDLEELIRHRIREGADKTRLERALAYTGSERIRLPDWYEDSVTMLAEATRRLLVRNPRIPLSEIRHYVSGTETAQDFAKPLSAWAQGLVEVRGERIGPAAATYEVKHACAGGTYAVLGVLNALRVEDTLGLSATGVVGMTDVASFLEGSTAELTQGAGAVALLLERDPKLLEIESALIGVWGESVDDFYRSIGSRHATVRGRYSVDCYLRALEGAYGDFKQRPDLRQLQETHRRTLPGQLRLCRPPRSVPFHARQGADGSLRQGTRDDPGRRPHRDGPPPHR